MTPLIAWLRLQEGDTLTVIDDATGKPVVPGYTMVGHPTIGTGFALDTGGITQDEDDLLLAHRAARAEGAVRGLFGAIDPVRATALETMAYQLGAGGLAAFHALIAAAKAGDWGTASAEALDSKWGRQTPARAAEVAATLLTGRYPQRLHGKFAVDAVEGA